VILHPFAAPAERTPVIAGSTGVARLVAFRTLRPTRVPDAGWP
jgi:hypothetical protein